MIIVLSYLFYYLILIIRSKIERCSKKFSNNQDRRNVYDKRIKDNYMHRYI